MATDSICCWFSQRRVVLSVDRQEARSVGPACRPFGTAPASRVARSDRNDAPRAAELRPGLPIRRRDFARRERSESRPARGADAVEAAALVETDLAPLGSAEFSRSYEKHRGQFHRAVRREIPFVRFDVTQKATDLARRRRARDAECSSPCGSRPSWARSSRTTRGKPPRTNRREVDPRRHGGRHFTGVRSPSSPPFADRSDRHRFALAGEPRRPSCEPDSKSCLDRCQS